MTGGERRRRGGSGCELPSVRLRRAGPPGGQAVVIPSRSRRRRKWTAAINALSGVVAVGSLIAVVELGGPVASNLGLGHGVSPTGPGFAQSPALQNPTASNFGSGATSVASATSSAPTGPAVPGPASAGVAAPHALIVVSAGAPAASPSEPAPTVVDTASSSHALTATPASANDPSKGGGDGAHSDAAADAQTPSTGPDEQGPSGPPGQGGQNGQNGQNGQQGQGQGQGNAGTPGPTPPGKALGHDH